MKKNELPVVSLAQLNEGDAENMLAQKLIFSDEKQNEFQIFRHPLRLDFITVGFCLQGEAKVEINLQSYDIRKNDIIFLLPGYIVQPLAKSDDFVGKSLFFDPDFIESGDVRRFPVFLEIKEFPRISLSDDEIAIVLEFYSFLRKQYNSRIDQVYRKEIMKKLLMAFLYEVGAIFQNNKPVEPSKMSRKEEILKSFIRLVSIHYRKERSVSFYAGQLCLTPKYLSTTVKEISHKTVVEWINAAVVLESKALLRSSQMTVQQIADVLNFPNPSFFGRFFKRHTGMTPKEYKHS